MQRHATPDAAKGEPEYQKRDYQLMAGPGAQRLAGTNRAFLIDGVAILPITGPIFPRANMMTEYSDATSINTLTDDYRKALDSSDVGAILLLVDCSDIADVKFFINGDRVATGTTFNMSQVPALALQPVARIGKQGAATSVGTLQVDYVRAWQKRSA